MFELESEVEVRRGGGGVVLALEGEEMRTEEMGKRLRKRCCVVSLEM